MERQRRGDIVAVTSHLELGVNVVLMHAHAKAYATQAAKPAGWTSVNLKDVPDHAAFRFVPIAVEPTRRRRLGTMYAWARRQCTLRIALGTWLLTMGACARLRLNAGG